MQQAFSFISNAIGTLRLPLLPQEAELQKQLAQLKRHTADFSSDEFDTRQNAQDAAIDLVKVIGVRSVPILLRGLDSSDPEVKQRFTNVIKKSAVFANAFKEDITKVAEVCVTISALYKTSYRLDFGKVTVEDSIKEITHASKLVQSLSEKECSTVMWVSRNIPNATDHLKDTDRVAMFDMLNPPLSSDDGRKKDTIPGMILFRALVKGMDPEYKGKVADLLLALAESQPAIFRENADEILELGIQPHSLYDDNRVISAWTRVGLNPSALVPPKK